MGWSPFEEVSGCPPVVTRMISRDGNPTSLGQAIAHYGRIFKTLQCATRRCFVRTEVRDHRGPVVVAAG